MEKITLTKRRFKALMKRAFLKGNCASRNLMDRDAWKKDFEQWFKSLTPLT
jgi:hypothetical protein